VVARDYSTALDAVRARHRCYPVHPLALPDETSQERRASRALAGVSLAVLLAGSTWFSGTAAIPTLRAAWGLSDAQSAWLTIAVQLGFITGTFLYAVFNLADVFNARRVFLVSAVLGAILNAGFAWVSRGLMVAAVFRFLTGVTLAGVYPVGMKIVASWFRTGLGWRLGVLVGALVLGTASPYLIQAVGAGIDWRVLATAGSLSALLGGAIVVGAVPDGPYLRARAAFDAGAALRVFARPDFRYTAFGYFGHMWELYAFWSLLGFYLRDRFAGGDAGWSAAIPLIAFATVGVGAVGCVVGGWISRRVGERRVALVSLVVSGAACALSGFAQALPAPALVAYLIVWGFFVVSDSPQFSALAARYCPPEYTATALTVQNGIGFAVTVVSIQLLPWIAGRVGWRWAFIALAVGPFVGAHFMRKLGRVDAAVEGS
jgi:MFS family permease